MSNHSPRPRDKITVTHPVHVIAACSDSKGNSTDSNTVICCVTAYDTYQSTRLSTFTHKFFQQRRPLVQKYVGASQTAVATDTDEVRDAILYKIERRSTSTVACHEIRTPRATNYCSTLRSNNNNNNNNCDNISTFRNRLLLNVIS